jgi:hypothetical protein
MNLIALSMPSQSTRGKEVGGQESSEKQHNKEVKQGNKKHART